MVSFFICFNIAFRHGERKPTKMLYRLVPVGYVFDPKSCIHSRLCRKDFYCFRDCDYLLIYYENTLFMIGL